MTYDEALKAATEIAKRLPWATPQAVRVQADNWSLEVHLKHDLTAAAVDLEGARELYRGLMLLDRVRLARADAGPAGSLQERLPGVSAP